ncbi:hypothetical protein GPUN_0714 [Glaciecola punicea ACAM 611]|uniref:Uncharacterized protein n=1 Tax=Glaciecola punicea ACAM 611 TaxID=1121923 RepID=H5T976_9ALTE|nr:hypothetical protein GPUN_0714 [Glaciecola punicea ACAM 611]
MPILQRYLIDKTIKKLFKRRHPVALVAYLARKNTKKQWAAK